MYTQVDVSFNNSFIQSMEALYGTTAQFQLQLLTKFVDTTFQYNMSILNNAHYVSFFSHIMTDMYLQYAINDMT